MSSTELSIFEELLETGLDKASEITGSRTSPTAKGAAFELLMAEWFLTEKDIDPEFDSVDKLNVGDWGGSNDLGIDLWFEKADLTSRKIVIVDTKYYSDYNKTCPSAQYESFFESWHKHINEKEVKGANDDVQDRLEGFEGRLLKEGWSVEYRYVTNRRLSQAGHERLRDANIEIKEKFGDASKIVVFDQHQLYTYYKDMQSAKRDLPPEISFTYEENDYTTLEGILPCSLVAISGIELHRLYGDFGKALFSFNLRGYLGSTDVNDKITASIKTEPEKFLYLNNGISILCTAIDDTSSPGELKLTKPQIVNGAQTVGAIGNFEDGPPSEDLKVMCRIIQTEGTDTDQGDNLKIIRANNRQNKLETYDTYANDEIQRFLEKSLIQENVTGLLKRFHYVPKQSKDTNLMGVKIHPRRGFLEITLPELARARYAFLHDDPMSLNGKDVARLWLKDTDEDDDKDYPLYNKAFGIDRKYEPVWPQRVVDEAKFIYATERYIAKRCNEVKREDRKEKNKALAAATAAVLRGDKPEPMPAPNWRCYPTFKWHLLALVGYILRNDEEFEDLELGTVFYNVEQRDKLFRDVVEPALLHVKKVHKDALEVHEEPFQIRVNKKYFKKMIDEAVDHRQVLRSLAASS